MPYFFLERDFLSAFTSFFAKLAAFFAVFTADFACLRLALAALIRERESSFGDTASASATVGGVSCVSFIKLCQVEISAWAIVFAGSERNLMLQKRYIPLRTPTTTELLQFTDGTPMRKPRSIKKQYRHGCTLARGATNDKTLIVVFVRSSHVLVIPKRRSEPLMGWGRRFLAGRQVASANRCRIPTPFIPKLF
jgi:hypothetical protein